MTKSTPAAEAPEGKVKEEDLLKSITDLEAKAEEAKPKEEPKVETETLKKTVGDTVQEKASDELKKALDVSSTLTEFVALIGGHVDESLETLQKSIQASAERDQAMIRVLTDLKKSIDANTEAVKAYGKEPTAPAAERPLTVKEEDVLRKTAEDKTEKELDPKMVRKTTLEGLMHMAKTAGDPNEQRRISFAVSKFETTGEITDDLLQKAQKTYKELTTA